MWGCGEHTADVASPQGNGNGIQMIHEITIKLLRVCKHGLQWGQPWKAQLKEAFDRRERGESRLALKEPDRIAGIGSTMKVSDQGGVGGGSAWTIIGHQKGAQWEEQNESKGSSWELCICGHSPVPWTVCPGTHRKNMSCLVKGSDSTWPPSPDREWKVISHLYWFLISVWFCLFKLMKMMCYCYVVMPEKVSPETSKMFLVLCPFHVVSLSPSFSPPSPSTLPSPETLLWYWWINIMWLEGYLERIQVNRQANPRKISDGKSKGEWS